MSQSIGTATVNVNRRQRRHGAAYWATIGWWWRPLCWAGRVLLWLVFWPAGLWRSIRHGHKADARR